MDGLFIGIDVGTTGAKVILIDPSGHLIAETTSGYPLSIPRPLWAEQDPREWWSASARGIKEVIAAAQVAPEAVAAVGLTGQMHGLVLLDDRGEVLRPAILWNDQRTAEECAAITERVGEKRILELTGNPILPGFTAPKIEWVRRHEPEVIARVAHVLLPKDYVRYRLTGEFHTDVADASGTSLLEVGKRAWSQEMLDALGIPPGWMPRVHESPVVCSEVSSSGFADCILPAGTPVVAGAGDQAAQAIGSGIVEEGLVSATLGTSGVVFAASDSYRVDPRGRLHAFCHAVPGKWHLMGVVLSAGGSFRWYRDTICEPELREAREEGGDAYELMTAAAEEVTAGCDGLIFLPYLTGERTPHPDPHARGAFVGLTLRHGRAHLTRAVMEGVTFALRDSFELMRDLGLTFDEVRASGGGANSPFWRRMMADVFATPVVTTKVTEGAAYGAALLAAVGAGAYRSVEDASRSVIEVGGRLEPGAGAGDRYEECYARYRALYPALVEDFRRAASD
jgi:xylulokinase